eukprot:Colp12_sorted_trinity150504_noHs@14652
MYPDSFLRWINKIDYWKYTLTYLLYNEISRLQIECKDSLLPLNMNDVFTSMSKAVNETALYTTNTTATTVDSLQNLFIARYSITMIAQTLPSIAKQPGYGTLAAFLTSLIAAGSQVQKWIEISAAPLINRTYIPDVNLSTIQDTFVGRFAFSFLMMDASQRKLPDYSYCVMNSSEEFIQNNFGVAPDLDDSYFGIALAFWLAWAAVAYLGLRLMKFQKR